MASKPQKVGLITATSLVVGNMIGAGIFMLPATLAQYGSISLLGWLFTAVGALILAKVFSIIFLLDASTDAIGLRIITIFFEGNIFIVPTNFCFGRRSKYYLRQLFCLL